MTHVPAPLGRRLVATLIDAVVIAAIIGAGSAPVIVTALGADAQAATARVAATAALAVVATLAAGIGFTAAKGSLRGTVGMRAMGVRLVIEGTDRKTGFWRAWWRAAVLSASALVIVGPFSPLFRTDRRGWHDLAAVTHVVDARAARSRYAAPDGFVAPAEPITAAPAPRVDSDQVTAAPAAVGASVISAVPGFARPEPAEAPVAAPRPPVPVAATPVVAEAEPAPAAVPVEVPVAAPEIEPVPGPVGDEFDIPGLADDDDDFDATRLTAPRAAVGVLTWDDGTVTVVAEEAIVGRNPSPVGSPRALLVAITDNTRSLSKTHFAVVATGEGFAVTDLHSTNGVRVVGAGGESALEPGVATVLVAGSRLVMGSRSAVFDVRHA